MAILQLQRTETQAPGFVAKRLWILTKSSGPFPKVLDFDQKFLERLFEKKSTVKNFLRHFHSAVRRGGAQWARRPPPEIPKIKIFA